MSFYVGLKFPIEDSTDYIEAHSLSYRNDYIQVYSNSWGPSDNGFIVDKPGSLLAMTLKDAVITVREIKMPFQIHLWYICIHTLNWYIAAAHNTGS